LLGASAVVITSTESLVDPDCLTLYASVRGSKFCIAFPKIHGRQFTGTGDLFASLILARWDGETRDSLITACEKGLVAMNGVLRRTNEKAIKAKGGNMRDCELCIIESRDVIENPELLFRAVML
jgi:pyridoxal/pyridoxine/pyridoxamine kinase